MMGHVKGGTHGKGKGRNMMGHVKGGHAGSGKERNALGQLCGGHTGQISGGIRWARNGEKHLLPSKKKNTFGQVLYSKGI
jgi:hypothetical protein